MKSKDDILLEQAYSNIITEQSIRLELFKNGFSQDEINWLVNEAGFMNNLKSFGKKAILPAVLATSMLTGQTQAKAEDPALYNNSSMSQQIDQGTKDLKSSINVSSQLMDIADKAELNIGNTIELNKLREQAKQLLKIGNNSQLDKALSKYSAPEFSGLNSLTTKRLAESLTNYNQPISEAKKKVNPWAVCNASTGGKKKNPKKFEKCVRGVKKNTIEENENIAPSSTTLTQQASYAKTGGYVNSQDGDDDPYIKLEEIKNTTKNPNLKKQLESILLQRDIEKLKNARDEQPVQQNNAQASSPQM
jgi:hypothetical protein